MKANATIVGELLANGYIIAIFQGRAESGPRALGNRSILWNPQIEDGKIIINNLKKREWWRPFAGVILEEDAPYWFDMKGMKSSPFMSYAVKLKNPAEYGNKINSILHNDYTCRIQTVNSEQNLELTNIIKTFKNILPNNPPILGNTSFNRAGEPLIHTIDDAITSLESNFIEYLYFPEEEKILYSSNT